MGIQASAMTYPYPDDFKMASVTHKEYQFPRKAEVRILPTTAHEVSCVLIYSIESPSGDVENVCLGQINDNVEDLSPVLVCKFLPHRSSNVSYM